MSEDSPQPTPNPDTAKVPQTLKLAPEKTKKARRDTTDQSTTTLGGKAPTGLDIPKSEKT